jgi:hypothetical protein
MFFVLLLFWLPEFRIKLSVFWLFYVAKIPIGELICLSLTVI